MTRGRSPEDQARAHPMGRLLRHARQHRGTVIGATACSVLNKLFDLAPPALIGAAVDVVVQQESSMLAAWGFASVEEQLRVLAVATVVIWGLESAFEYAYKLLWRNLAQTLQHELRLDAYAHAQTLDMAFFDRRGTGDLMAVLNDDVNQLERFLDGGANDLIQVGTTTVIVSLAFFAISPAIAALAILPVPFVVAGGFWFQARLAARYARVRERVGVLNADLANNLGGIATIKAFTGEDRETGRVEGESQAYREANRDAIALSSAFSPVIRMVIVVGFTATLLVGGRMAVAGTLAVGSYSVLVFLTQRLLWPLTRLGSTVDLYQRAMASAARVLDLLDERPAIVDGDAELGEVEGAVEFEGVRFAYPGRDPVLNGLDLAVGAGETLGVVGSTGAGKTTLVKLLLRFYDPTHGAVRLDGHELPTLRLADLRRAIGLVSQDVFLFPGSVHENIAYGAPDSSRAQVEEAARLAEAHDFVAALPEGYDTQVGERGQRLSGGQRQRLALARAILRDPPVLVLDEATSAVDNETEAAIQRSLLRVAEGRTVVVIAHRLSTVRHADRIVVLDAGRVAEEGTHEELLTQGGTYAMLWAVQTGEGATTSPPEEAPDARA